MSDEIESSRKEFTNQLRLKMYRDNSLSQYISHLLMLISIVNELSKVTSVNIMIKTNINKILEELIKAEYEAKKNGSFTEEYFNKKLKGYNSKIIELTREFCKNIQKEAKKFPLYQLQDYINKKLSLDIKTEYIEYVIEKFMTTEFEIKEVDKKGKIIKYLYKKSINQIANKNKSLISNKKKARNTINEESSVNITKENEVKVIILLNSFKKECLCNHHLKALKAKVIVFDYKLQDFIDIMVSTNYCLNCDVHYTTKSELRVYVDKKNYYLIADHYNEKDIYLVNGIVGYLKENNYRHWNDKSFLANLGYNVTEKNLTETGRLNILKRAIDIHGYYEVKNHLEFLINDRESVTYKGIPGSLYFNKALEKWKYDLKRVIDLETDKTNSSKQVFKLIEISNRGNKI